MICVALFIATPTIGPEISIPVDRFGKTWTKVMVPAALGDGRNASSNSKQIGPGNYPKQGGSRGYVYLFMDDCGQLQDYEPAFNRSYILGGFQDLGFGPYPQFERFEARQAIDGAITVTWDMPNGASAWARQNQTFFTQLKEESAQLPGPNDAQTGYALATALYQVAEWAINLDTINGSMTITYDKESAVPYKVTTMSRDPYPSLEAYHYKDGDRVGTLLIRPETPDGPYVGLRPDAPRDTIP